MSNSEWITFWGVAIGLLITLVGSGLLLAFYIGNNIGSISSKFDGINSKFDGINSKFDGINRRFDRIENDIASIRQEIKGIWEDISKIKFTMGQMQVKLDALWQHHTSKSNSPLSLSEAGLKILEISGIGEFANHYYPEVLSKVKAIRPENAYQAQKGLISIMNDYKNKEECRPKLEEVSYSSGSDIDTLLFVAALSIRDKIISDLGF